MANYLASIFGTEQDKVDIAITPYGRRNTELTKRAFERSTVHSTIRSAPVATAIAVLENMSSPRTRKPFSSPTSTRTQPMTPKIR